MKGKNEMTAKVPSCDANIPDDAHQSPAWYQNPKHMLPDFLELEKKCIIILNVP